MDYSYGENNKSSPRKTLSLTRSLTDQPLGSNYVAGRRHNKAKKDKKKARKERNQSVRSSSTHSRDLLTLNHSNSSLTNNEDDDFTTPSVSVTRTTSSGTTSRASTRASVSPGFLLPQNSARDIFDYGSEYVLPPKEEESLLTPSAAADPNDPLKQVENFHDEYEGELDDIEMTSKRGGPMYMTERDMEAKKLRQTRLRKCCSWICICLVVGAVVGTIVYLLAFKESEKTPQAVPKASKLLKLWCAEELDKGPGEEIVFPLQVPKDCEVACRKADCCWNPDSEYECTPETVDQCADYKSPCKIMLAGVLPEDQEEANQNDEVEVPKAPATLKTTCVPTGPDFTATPQCYNICKRAECCWNTTSELQCSEDSWQANCGPYEEFCSFFNDHPPSTTSSGAEDLPFPYATPELPNFCSVENIQNNGPQQCQQECSTADCCWKVGTVSCTSRVPDNMCQEYADACKVLNELDVILDNNNGGDQGDNNNAAAGIPPAPDGLDVYCDPSSMEEISLHICQDKCEKASCCWDEDVKQCPDTVPAEMCQPYVQACAILNDLETYDGKTEETNNNAGANNDNDNVPQAPNDFQQRCSKDNILGADNGGDVLIQCERDCLAAKCCWQPDVDGCSDNNRCAAYEEHCAIFIGLFDSSSSSNAATTNNGSTNSGSASKIPAAPSDINDTCASSNLSPSVNNGQDIVKCERECLAASCCWKDTGSSASCTGEPNCQAYMEPCGNNLVNALVALESGTSIAQATGTRDHQAKQEIDNACNTQVAVFVEAHCKDVCRPGDCCFDDTMACGTGVDCGIYDACGVIHDRRRTRQLRH